MTKNNEFDETEEVTEDAEDETEEVTEDAEDEAAAEDAALTESDEADTETEVKKSTVNTPASKNNKNRNIAVIVVIIVIVLAVIVLLTVNDVIGTGTGTGTGIDAGGGSAQGVVAKVGDAEITQDMVDRETTFVMFSNYGKTLDALAPEEQIVLKNQILVYFLVQSELVKEHLRDQGTETLSAEQQAAVEESIDKYYASIENAEATLSAMGVTREDVKYFLELNEYMWLYQQEVLAANPVTDEEVQQFYDENQSYFVSPAQISASHILIMDADHTPEKRAELEAILERARGGEDFAALATEFSEDTGSATKGGDVGYFGESNNFVPEFSAAALALASVGDISDIVETEYGYHIIKLTDKQEATSQPIDEVRDDIVNYLGEIRTSEAAAELKNEIDVKYYVDVDPATGEPPTSLPEADEAAPEITAETDPSAAGAVPEVPVAE
ncbi:MAG: peptidylprolyl isomerase [Clostridiales Family XIII bacterium]|jgi:parvulin-like peptidyl-prolyl isomerase|nr:peptidylprolyl isomerase [Clostridiales Family XIII bacterium]